MIKLYECEENSIQVQHHQSVQEAKIMKDLCIFEKTESFDQHFAVDANIKYQVLSPMSERGGGDI